MVALDVPLCSKNTPLKRMLELHSLKIIYVSELSN